MEQCKKNVVAFVSPNRTAAILGTKSPQKLMKLFEEADPTNNPIAGKKNDQKSIYKGPRALALILALIAIYKTLRPKIKKIRPLLIYNRGYIIDKKLSYFSHFVPPSPIFRK